MRARSIQRAAVLEVLARKHLDRISPEDLSLARECLLEFVGEYLGLSPDRIAAEVLERASWAMERSQNGCDMMLVFEAAVLNDIVELAGIWVPLILAKDAKFSPHESLPPHSQISIAECLGAAANAAVDTHTKVKLTLASEALWNLAEYQRLHAQWLARYRRLRREEVPTEHHLINNTL